MATQAPSSHILDGVALDAWTAFLRTHAGVTRRLNADLLAVHALTLNDYEVLLYLSRAPDRRLRRVDLVERLLLTPSGITRLLEGLERARYVTKAACESDARVTYAVLTDAGYEKLRAAARTHVAGVREQFVGRFSDEELQTLASLLARLPAASAEPEACEPTD
jgi:DNA-binding MarR family transcriptional regulator